MANITLRNVKGSPLTNAEVDGNFSNLNLLKVEIGGDLVGDPLSPSLSPNATPTVSQITVTGNVIHSGLLPTQGTSIDQIKVFTKTLTLSTDWQDVGINNVDLATGTYIVQMYAHDVMVGGTNNNEYYSGTLSWYEGATSSSLELPTDEIVLHRAGASGEAGLYLRTYRSEAGDINNLKLQIYSNTTNSSAANYVFKFRRLI